MKKGEGLPITTISFAIIGLLVILLVSIFLIDNLDNSNTGINSISKEYKDLFSSKINFETTPNGNTLITILVESDNDKPVDVYHTIPKEVIPQLTNDNRDELIQSNQEFVIIKEDPLIAWHVEKPPATINYTINKEISLEDRNNFSVEIKESEKFNKLKFLVYFLIITIIVLTLEPIFKKKK